MRYGAAMLACLLVVALTPIAHADPPADATAARASVDVRTSDPGRGRAGRLAVRTTVGDRWQMQLRRTSSTSAALDGGERVASTAPESVQELTLSTHADGTTAAITGVDLVGAPFELQLQLREAERELTALTYRAPADPQQRTTPQLAETPESLSPMAYGFVADLAWALDLATVPLPDDPVAPGATWTWVRQGEEHGATVTQRFTATLDGRRGRRARVELAVQLDGAPGPTPSGERVDALSATGSGTAWIRLDRPLVQALDLSMAGTLALSWTDETGDHALDGAFEATLVVATREAPANPVPPRRARSMAPRRSVTPGAPSVPEDP